MEGIVRGVRHGRRVVVSSGEGCGEGAQGRKLSPRACAIRRRDARDPWVSGSAFSAYVQKMCTFPLPYRVILGGHRKMCTSSIAAFVPLCILRSMRV